MSGWDVLYRTDVLNLIGIGVLGGLTGLWGALWRRRRKAQKEKGQ